MTGDHTDSAERSIFERLGVPEVINAAGTKTRVGGTRLRPEAAEAMQEASDGFVRISDLQAEASKRIAESTGADAGYITTGASSALTLAAAACLAGDDLSIMNRLPHTEGIPNEIVMARSHRTGYDHAFRLAGANIVDVGTFDRDLGSGSTNLKRWELDDAIGEDTAAVGYVATSRSEPPLETLVDVAHTNGVPVIVDAAAELPPKSNLSRFIEQEADLVAFSGGKAIQGPQATGILAGRQELIRSVAFQQLDMDIIEELWEPPEELFGDATIDGVPRHGIGRGMKVGREELVGIITAFEQFVEENDQKTFDEWDERARQMADRLQDEEGLHVSISGTEDDAVTNVEIQVDSTVTGFENLELVRHLQQHDPQVYVGFTDAPDSPILLNPMCLTDDEAGQVTDILAGMVTEA